MRSIPKQINTLGSQNVRTGMDRVDPEKAAELGALLLIIGILALMALLIIPQSSGESGGTDEDITIEASAGGSGAFDWNDTHAFVIKEQDSKVNRKFDVVLCEDLKYNESTEKHDPYGYIFGSLDQIHWDDQPPPSITITRDEFELYQSDVNNLSMYVLGEYENGDGEIRYAFCELNLTKPNHSPRPVALYAVGDNWSWIEANTSAITTFIIETEDIQVNFDASQSWDQDDEEVVEWRWDLDEDGRFGYMARERGVNVTAYRTTGKVYMVGLLVIDERGKVSDVLTFEIRFLQKPSSGGIHPDTRISGFVGTIAGYEWNEVNNLLMREEGQKIEERFNVTFCKDIEWNGSTWVMGEPILGKISGIRWDDDPKPYLSIPRHLFDLHKDDPFNMTFYIYGQYHHSSKGYRYAYQKLIMRRPNNPPVPVVRVAPGHNWSWMNITDEQWMELTIPEGEDVKLWFDASRSWDPDGDEIIAWKWKLDPLGGYGADPEDRNSNTSGTYGYGNHRLGLMIHDGGSGWEEFTFRVTIVHPIWKPDLVPVSVDIIELGTNESDLEMGSAYTLHIPVWNAGKNWTKTLFTSAVAYELDGETELHQLATIDQVYLLEPNETVNLLWTWDISPEHFLLESLTIHITIDIFDTIVEENEFNNTITQPVRIVDTLPPVVGFLEPQEGATVSGLVTIQGTAEDNRIIHGVEYGLLGENDEIDWAPANGTILWRFSYNVSNMKGTSITFYARANDGIRYSEPVSLTLKLEDEKEDESNLPETQYLFIMFLIVVTIGVVVFTKDEGKKGRFKKW